MHRSIVVLVLVAAALTDAAQHVCQPPAVLDTVVRADRKTRLTSKQPHCVCPTWQGYGCASPSGACVAGHIERPESPAANLIMGYKMDCSDCRCQQAPRKAITQVMHHRLGLLGYNPGQAQTGRARIAAGRNTDAHFRKQNGNHCHHKDGYRVVWQDWARGMAPISPEADRAALESRMEVRVAEFIERARRSPNSAAAGSATAAATAAGPGRPFLFQTWLSRGQLPDKIFLQAAKYAPGFQHLILNDTESDAYMATRDPEIAATYLQLKSTAHRADLLRYCLLLENGGLYVDMDMVLLHPVIDGIAPDDDLHTQTTCLSAFAGVMQAVLWLPVPGSPFLAEIIRDFLATPLTDGLPPLSKGCKKCAPQSHLYFTKRFELILTARLGGLIKGAGLVNESDGAHQWGLLQERCAKKRQCGESDTATVCSGRWDAKNLCCSVETADGRVVMLSRDPEYPEGYVDKLAPLPRNAGQPRIDRRKAVPPPGQEKESAAQNTS